MTRFLLSLVCLFAIACVGCGDSDPAIGPDPAEGSGVTATGELPVFTLSISEYPSWTVYLVAAKYGWINRDQGGEHGTLEKEHGVDIVLKAVDYDKCITDYGNSSPDADAVCVTSNDVLPLAQKRNTTVILPTSTTAGADQIIGVGINDLDELKQHKIHLLTKSVSDVAVFLALEKVGRNYRDYQIEPLDPAAAATALQNNSPNVKAICVWNPFALLTLNKNPKAKTLLTTEVIAGVITDTVAVGNDTLKRPGGENFAKCVCEIYYKVSAAIDNPSTRDTTLKLLAEDFAPDLSVEDMKVVVTQTRFYSTPAAGSELFKSEEFRNSVATVQRACLEIESLQKENVPTIGYGDPSAELNFDPRFIDAVK